MIEQAPFIAGRVPPSNPVPWYRDPVRAAWMLIEVTLTALLMLGYFLVRGGRPDNVEESVRRSVHLVRFEQQLGIFQEVRWQQTFIQHDLLMNIANQIYAWGHYPVMLALAVWLMFTNPLRFRFARNVVFVSALAGIVTYYLLPAAPPRLMAMNGYDFGFVDTVHGAASNVDYFQPSAFVNDYAALPSFHFGWLALSSAVLWANTRRRSVKAIAVAMSGVMWWAVTVTGNHYFFDMIFGGTVVAVSWILVGALAQAPLPARIAALVGEPSSRWRAGQRPAP